tara:strand:- start:2074 stop:2517 length:444 start_codon:yes stop_codon:yes gene_type:complete
MVAVNINVNVTAAKGSLNRLQRRIPTATIKGIAVASTFIQNAIKDRTRKGISVSGSPFKKYSKAYAKKRAARGSTLTPNLFFTGQMLGNMSFKVLSKTKGQVFFPNRTQNLKAFFNDKTRPFFDVNNKEEARAVKEFKKAFERELRI